MEELYQIWKLDIYSEDEKALGFIYTDKKIADLICDNKNMCNDINVLSWEYEVRTIKLIKNEKDIEINYLDIYTFLETNTLLDGI